MRTLCLTTTILARSFIPARLLCSGCHSLNTAHHLKFLTAQTEAAA